MKITAEERYNIYRVASSLEEQYRQERLLDGLSVVGMCYYLKKAFGEVTGEVLLGYESLKELFPEWYSLRPSKEKYQPSIYWFSTRPTDINRQLLFNKLVKQSKKVLDAERKVKLVKVLKDLYDYFIEHPRYNNGLCYALCLIYSKTWGYEHSLFHEYAEQYTKVRKRFYNYNGEIVSDNNQYWWKTTDHKARVNWLDKQIKKLA